MSMYKTCGNFCRLHEEFLFLIAVIDTILSSSYYCSLEFNVLSATKKLKVPLDHQMLECDYMG